MKMLLPSLTLITTSLFAMHPLSDYTECQQPYIEKLRNGDSAAFKKSIVDCRAKLWNEDMVHYTNYNYRKFSATSLSCAGDSYAIELLKREHGISLRRAATFYRLAAEKGDQTAKINLIFLTKEGKKVLYIGNTQEAYTKVFDANQNSKTFIQIFNSIKDVKKEDHESFEKKYKEKIIDYTKTCTNSLEKDLAMVGQETKDLDAYFINMSASELDTNGDIVNHKEDKEFKEYVNIWGNIENRNLKAQIEALNAAMEMFTGIQEIFTRH